VHYILPSAARPNLGVLPPAEYDKPYTGKLKTIRGDAFVMKVLCPKTSQPITLGCSWMGNGECVVVVADDGLIYDSGWSPMVIWRHERGHCIGWPVDHRGARPVTSETLCER